MGVRPPSWSNQSSRGTRRASASLGHERWARGREEERKGGSEEAAGAHARVEGDVGGRAERELAAVDGARPGEPSVEAVPAGAVAVDITEGRDAEVLRVHAVAQQVAQRGGAEVAVGECAALLV